MVDGMGRCMGRGNPLRLPCPHCDPFADDDNGWVGAIPRGCPVAVPALLWERQGDQSDAMNRVPTGCPATGSPVDNASGVDNGWVGAIPRGCPAAVPALLWERQGDQSDAMTRVGTAGWMGRGNPLRLPCGGARAVVGTTGRSIGRDDAGRDGRMDG